MAVPYDHITDQSSESCESCRLCFVHSFENRFEFRYRVRQSSPSLRCMLLTEYVCPFLIATDQFRPKLIKFSLATNLECFI